ncbi:hypothetical protein [Amycolatopsis oliviviridis]|nr:hypothetical protein [Amycolatopsis oliviviridis]
MGLLDVEAVRREASLRAQRLAVDTDRRAEQEIRREIGDRGS